MRQKPDSPQVGIEPIVTRFGRAMFDCDTPGQITLNFEYNPDFLGYSSKHISVASENFSNKESLRKAVVNFLFENRDATTHDLDDRLMVYLSEQGFEVCPITMYSES